MVQQAIWSPQRAFALVGGVVFTVLGVVGFLLTATMQVGEVFGVFDVDLVHNLILLISGIMLLVSVLAARPRTFILAFGIFYTLLGLAGLLPAFYFPGSAYGTDSSLFLGLMHDNAADHILHLVAGLLALLVAVLPTSSEQMVEVRVPDDALMR